MNGKRNLIWIQVEGAGVYTTAGNDLKNIVADLSFPFCEFTNMVCAAPTTIMSTVGMLTGVPPVNFIAGHISKKTKNAFKWKDKSVPVLTEVLDNNGYSVLGFHMMNHAPEYIPWFYDSHQGATDDMPRAMETLPHYWPPGVLAKRFKNISSSLASQGNALFFHVWWREDLVGVLDCLEKEGFSNRNSVFVLVGDHGSAPYYNDVHCAGMRYATEIGLLKGSKVNQHVGQLPHDLEFSERNLRVRCFIASSNIQKSFSSQLSSAIDIAPTALNQLGLSGSDLLPKACGMDLLSNDTACTVNKDRIIRIDNRYVGQTKHKIIGLISEKYRYIFRFANDWDVYPFYKYRSQEVQYIEELYDRHTDHADQDNLIVQSEFSADIIRFRDVLINTEKQIRDSIFEKSEEKETLEIEQVKKDRLLHDCLLLLRLYLSKEKGKKLALYTRREQADAILNANLLPRNDIVAVFDDQEKTGKDTDLHMVWDEKVLRACLLLFVQSKEYGAGKKVAIYGAGKHTQLLLEQRIITSVVVIFDEAPKCNVLCGVPVKPVANHSAVDFDVLLLSSHLFEEEMMEKVRCWVPAGKLVVPLYKRFCEEVFCDGVFDVKQYLYKSEYPLIHGVPIIHPSLSLEVDFDIVLITSREDEPELLINAQKWFNDDAHVIPLHKIYERKDITKEVLRLSDDILSFKRSNPVEKFVEFLERTLTFDLEQYVEKFFSCLGQFEGCLCFSNQQQAAHVFLSQKYMKQVLQIKVSPYAKEFSTHQSCKGDNSPALLHGGNGVSADNINEFFKLIFNPRLNIDCIVFEHPDSFDWLSFWIDLCVCNCESLKAFLVISKGLFEDGYDDWDALCKQYDFRDQCRIEKEQNAIAAIWI